MTDAVNNDLFQMLSQLSESTKSLLEETEKLLCCGNDISSKPAVVYIQFLTDALTKENKGDIALFLTGKIARVSKNAIFREPFKNSSLETYSKPMVILSDGDEIDFNIKPRIVARCGNADKSNNPEFISFPVIIFSDDVFDLHEGQHFGYSNIIDELQDAFSSSRENDFSCKVMALKYSDVVSSKNMFVPAYTDYIGYSVKLAGIKKIALETREYLGSRLDVLVQKIDGVKLPFAKLAAIGKAKACCKLLDSLSDKLNNIDEKIKNWNGFLNKLRESYDRRILELVSSTPLKSDSPYVVNIQLKYRDFRLNMKEFTEQIKKSSLMKLPNGMLVNPINDCIEFTEKKIDCVTSELSLLGTFSSGKTTMINTLIGHKKKLRTSKNHNTAVLMNIFYKGEKGERYEVFYKKEFTWDLIKPNSFDRETTISMNCKAKVLEIKNDDRNNSQIIVLKSIDSNEKQNFRIRSGQKLKIKVGDVIEPDEIITEKNLSKDKFYLAPYNELSALVELITKNKIGSPKIEYFTEKNNKPSFISGNDDVIKFITHLMDIKKYNAAKKSRSVTAERSDFSVFKDKFSGIVKACIKDAQINLSHETVKLDEKGWTKLFGTTDVQDETIPFSESPSCYMLADHINLYLDSEFLKYCSISDTPGFGSVTEEHDNITERFIKENGGRLLVMISVNSKTKDAKLVDFLNFLTNIYMNFRKDRIDEVYFMLNTFTNNIIQEQLEKDCRSIANDLEKRGFTRKNIFACDLRKAVDGDENLKKLFGLPSYAVFKNKCINEMLESGIKRNFASIYSKWKECFQKNMTNLKSDTDALRGELKEREKMIEELSRQKEEIESIDIDSIDAVLDKTWSDFYEPIFLSINNTFSSYKKRSGLFWRNRERRDKCDELMRNFVEKGVLSDLDKYFEEIKTKCKKAFQQLEFVCNDDLDYDLEPTGLIFTISLESIKNMLFEADDNTGLFDFFVGNAEYYMGQIKSKIKKDYEESVARAKNYYRSVCEQFEHLKYNFIAHIEYKLDGLGSPEKFEEEIKRKTSAYNDISRYNRLFDKNVENPGVKKTIVR